MTFTRNIELPAGTDFPTIKAILENSNVKFVSVADYDKKCVILTVSGASAEIMNLYSKVHSIH